MGRGSAPTAPSLLSVPGSAAGAVISLPFPRSPRCAQAAKRAAQMETQCPESTFLIISWQIKAIFLSCICSHENLCHAQALASLSSPAGKTSPAVVWERQELLVETARSDRFRVILMELHGKAVGLISSALVRGNLQPLMSIRCSWYLSPTWPWTLPWIQGHQQLLRVSRTSLQQLPCPAFTLSEPLEQLPRAIIPLTTLWKGRQIKTCMSHSLQLPIQEEWNLFPQLCASILQLP